LFYILKPMRAAPDRRNSV